MSELHELAAAAGLQADWQDAMGEAQRVSDDALIVILNALGLPSDSKAAIADSRDRLTGSAADCSFFSADAGQALHLPGRCGSPGPAELVLEDGSRQDLSIERDGADLRVPGIATTGYHSLVIGNRELRLGIAPPRCFQVSDAVPGKRIWGPSVQIAGLRGKRPDPYGDFGALADAARSFARRGADALAISPVHALFPADARRYSPYAPSSRLFLNVLYADAGLLGAGANDAPGDDLIDWSDAIPRRMRSLREAYDRRTDGVRDAVAAYVDRGGTELLRHARFDALHAHFFALSGATGWQGWPAAFHDPSGPAVAQFAGEHADDVGFYLFLQWLAKQSLDAAQRAATDGGMALGLIADLAVGMDPGGSHAWSRADDLLTGLSLGAPPDLLGPDGQSWGITGFAPDALRRTGFEPFIATLRAALDHAGGIRIDHALGLRRLWVVPEGASPKEGAYLNMPLDDSLRILAIESQRAKAIVIGEDLGTVPEGFRPAMDEKAMLGMRVLWFERDADGNIVPPDQWTAAAAAMTGTHDLPTVAGYWRGRDIDWTWQLGRTSRAADKETEQAMRAEERARLWQAFTDAGVTDQPEPALEDGSPAVDAATAFVASTPCTLAILPIEDIVGLVEQPNLPGTIDEHPNWRRRMPDTAEALLERADVKHRIERVNAARAG